MTGLTKVIKAAALRGLIWSAALLACPLAVHAGKITADSLPWHHRTVWMDVREP